MAVRFGGGSLPLMALNSGDLMVFGLRASLVAIW